MNKSKIILFSLIIGLVIVSGIILANKPLSQETSLGATVLFPYQGGTGLGSAAGGDVGKCLSLSNNSPFTYTFATCAGGSTSSYLGVDFGTIGGSQLKISSISFESNSFSLSNTASQGFVRVNWGTSGIASRSQSNTWSALNIFSNGASVSTNFEVGQNASISTGFVNNYLDFRGESTHPANPTGNAVRLHAMITQGFTRLEQENEAATDIVYGRDSVFIAKNTTGSTITPGQVVYVSGSTGNVPNIALAKANSLTTLPDVGIVVDSIGAGNFGQVMQVGIINNIDTSALGVSGTQVYVSPTTAGGLIGTRPSNPNYVQRVGTVLVNGIGNGSLQIMIAPAIQNRETGTVSSTYLFGGSASVSTNFEVSGYASLSQSIFANNGKMGIGTASLSEQLTVGAPSVNSNFSLRSATNNQMFFGMFNDSVTWTMNRRPSDGKIINPNQAVAELYMETGNNTSDIQFFTGNSNGFYGERMRIDKDGNIGIGTSVPTAKLSVNGTASVSGAFTQHSIASNSFLGSLTGQTTGTLSVGTSNNPLKILWSNIIKAIVQFFFPTTTSTVPSTSGEAIVNTASGSLEVYTGSANKILDGQICKTFVVDSPTASNPGYVGPVYFDDPFTITSVGMIASGSNAAGWNLKYGAPGAITTSVFTANKSASTSSSPVYTTLNNSTLTDKQGLEVVITSRSAVLQSFSVTACGRKSH